MVVDEFCALVFLPLDLSEYIFPFGWFHIALTVGDGSIWGWKFGEICTKFVQS